MGLIPERGFQDVDLGPRTWIARGVMVLAIILLFVRAFFLQAVRGAELERSGQRNFIQEVERPHERGMILDRYGRLLVGNRPRLDLYAIPYFLGSATERSVSLNRVASLLGIQELDLEKARDRIETAGGWDRFRPVLLKQNLAPEEVDLIEQEKSLLRLDGIDIQAGHQRVYYRGEEIAHVLGYVREIDPEGLRRAKAKGNPLKYQRGDRIGRFGAESGFEKELRGEDGRDYFVVDAKGRVLSQDHEDLAERALEPKPTVPGHNLVLTIDAELQAALVDSFDGAAGSAVVLDVATGDILAMASFPGFDPNRVSGEFSLHEKTKLDHDPLQPWLNRSIQEHYAPGSIFKVVTALAALESGEINPNETVFCPGYYRFGNRRWRCHRAAGHGHVDIKDAMKVSCDTYFYDVAARIGIDPIASMGKRLGLGAKIDLGLRGEVAGVMPDEAWHDKIDKRTGGYQRGMALNTSIGQGSVVATPLQMAMVYRSVAARGNIFAPRLVQAIERPAGRTYVRTLDEASGGEAVRIEEHTSRSIDTQPLRQRDKVELEPWAWDAVWDGLWRVANQPGGTAYYRRPRNVDYEIMGKTGTAQVVDMKGDRVSSEDLLFWSRDHAWFAAIAPADHPEIVVVVLNEHGGHGSSGAAPIAVRVIEAYMELQAGRTVTFPSLPQAEAEEGGSSWR